MEHAEFSGSDESDAFEHFRHIEKSVYSIENKMVYSLSFRRLCLKIRYALKNIFKIF